jgi:Ribbon-helix-helix protein, copG family
MNERTTVRLPSELLKRAKRMAADEGTTLTALIEDGLRRVIAKDQPKAKRPRGPVPVSKATGGLLPGVDITKFSDIQGMDDLEYAERMKRGFK